MHFLGLGILHLVLNTFIQQFKCDKSLYFGVKHVRCYCIFIFHVFLLLYFII